MREENGTFQDLRPAGERSSALGTGAAGEGAPDLPGVELAQRSSGQILDSALDIARGRFGLYVLAASVVWVFARALQPFLGQQQTQEWMLDGRPGLALAAMGVNVAATMFVQQMALVLVALLAWPRLVGTRIPFWSAVGRAFLAVFPLLLVTLVISSVTFAAMCLTCGLGALYLAWKSSLVPVTYVVERAGLVGCVTRSWQLTSHERTDVQAFHGFLRWFAVMGTAYVVQMAFSSLGGAADLPEVRRDVIDRTGMSEWTYDGAVLALTSLFNGLGTAIYSVIALAFYVDCRVRRDGLDLARKLEDLRVAWPASARAEEVAPASFASAAGTATAWPASVSTSNAPSAAPRSAPGEGAPVEPPAASAGTPRGSDAPTPDPSSPPSLDAPPPRQEPPA
ncbi:MAG: hypothetical protein IPJ77_09095 [Planctomycetes bacterium]|nr:hypothetical protein [Planctomycetota bacterium]